MPRHWAGCLMLMLTWGSNWSTCPNRCGIWSTESRICDFAMNYSNREIRRSMRISEFWLGDLKVLDLDRILSRLFTRLIAGPAPPPFLPTSSLVWIPAEVFGEVFGAWRKARRAQTG